MDVKIAVCPCGKIPTAIGIYGDNQVQKWAFAVPDCCGEWMIEFRSNYLHPESAECKELAIRAWNDAPRG